MPAGLMTPKRLTESQAIALEGASMLPLTMLQPCDSQALPRDDFLSKLNGEQRAAVEMAAGAHGRPAGPLLIVAGAGTGKTNTLAHLVAKLIVDGADPRRILLLTFSRRASKELIPSPLKRWAQPRHP
jgi:primosomal protein N'